MTVHQLNGDGAGPMKCTVDSTASGQFTTEMKIITDVPGKNGVSKARDQDFPLVAQMPDGVECKGGAGEKTGLCFVRCENAVKFGAIVPVQMGQSQQAPTPVAASAAVETEVEEVTQTVIVTQTETASAKAGRAVNVRRVMRN